MSASALEFRPASRITWLWRAWAANRSRICDCGTALASSEDEAKAIAWHTLGGPWCHEVVEMQIERIGLVTP